MRDNNLNCIIIHSLASSTSIWSKISIWIILPPLIDSLFISCVTCAIHDTCKGLQEVLKRSAPSPRSEEDRQSPRPNRAPDAPVSGPPAADPDPDLDRCRHNDSEDVDRTSNRLRLLVTLQIVDALCVTVSALGDDGSGSQGSSCRERGTP